jgi:hypothetical protein
LVVIFWFTDFDDMSCEMIFGQEPPSSTDDPALKQPCYKLCNIILILWLLTFIYILIIKMEGEKKNPQIISLSSQIYANLVYKGILFILVIWKLWSVFLRDRPLLVGVCLNISIFIGVSLMRSLFYSIFYRYLFVLCKIDIYW